MTQEEKAKRYDIALDKIKMLLGRSSSCSREELEYVFPELKESEDEKIRKEILDFCKNRAEKYPNDPKYKNISAWIAWLEKQGEKGTNGNERDFPISEPPLTIKHAKEVMGIKQDDAWSEEDEVALCDALWCCKQAASIAKDENDMGNVWFAENWLNSLKERMLSQPKQEWREEDSEYLDSIIESYKDLIADYKASHDVDYIPYDSNTVVRTVTNDVNFLKTLKDRYTWKPSDEQMSALNYVVNLMASSESPKENDYYYNVFKDWREQLKKLKA